MSKEYDDYIAQHRANVYKAFDWIDANLPDIFAPGTYAKVKEHMSLQHDFSKEDPEEYEAYDDYFYNKPHTKEVEANFNRAWLRHIHLNPHHWQYWVLIHDDEPEEVLPMPFEYIIEMICDWWSFSWKSGNLEEIFDWYEKHKCMKLNPSTRSRVEYILQRIKDKLENKTLSHHGIKGQQWGVKNGPPYPIDHSENDKLKNASGKSIIKADSSSLTGKPNSITQITHKHGGIDRNYYDEEGKQKKQISNNDHGHPKSHKYGEHGEHAHDYIYDSSGSLVSRPIRDLNKEERKENSDIL